MKEIDEIRKHYNFANYVTVLEMYLKDNLFWENKYSNPIDMIEIISTFIDNNDKFQMNIWISLDENIYICVTDQNINQLIKYIYERYPN